MDNVSVVISIVIVVFLMASYFILFKGKKNERNNPPILMNENNKNDLQLVSRKIVVPLKIQACERLLLYIERIQFPVLVKRVFIPQMSRSDFQFSILQNVQDEFEHNLAQRLYVSEQTWQLIVLAKEEVLQNVNAVFNDNPDADVAMIAQKLVSFENPVVEQAVISIKREFNAL